jgi:small subunit ribosomal protein S5
METTTEQKNTTPAPAAPRDMRGRGGDMRDQKKNPRRSFSREARVKPEFDQQIISIRRVTRVASGGRRFSFSVALVAGNRKGMVGVGTGKAGDTSIAIDKARKNAKKNMFKIPLTETMSIPYGVEAKFCSSRVHIMPAPGKGLVAGSSVRNVLELGGVNDVTAKIFSRSKNKLNNAEVAMQALKMLSKKNALTKSHAPKEEKASN